MVDRLRLGPTQFRLNQGLRVNATRTIRPDRTHDLCGSSTEARSFTSNPPGRGQEADSVGVDLALGADNQPRLLVDTGWSRSVVRDVVVEKGKCVFLVTKQVSHVQPRLIRGVDVRIAGGGDVVALESGPGVVN